MLKRTMIGLLLVAAGPLASHAAHADIFRCVGAGSTMYTDQPCPPGMTAADVITSVQVCGSADCERRLERENQEAQERRRREEAQLAILEGERVRLAEENARLEALRSREAVAPAPLAPAESLGPSYPVESFGPGYPVESFGPGYPIVVVPVWTCVGARCFPRPHPVVGKPGCVGARCFPLPHHPPHDPDHRHHHDSHASDPHPGTTHADGRHNGRSPRAAMPTGVNPSAIAVR